MRIQIIGIGRLGSQIAFCCLAFLKVKELWLDDIKDLTGDILDLKHAKAGLEVKTRIKEGRAKKPNIIIISAGFPRNEMDKTMNSIYYKNRRLLDEVLKDLPDSVPVIMATNPVSQLTSWATKRYGVWNRFYNAEEILREYRDGKNQGWEIVKTKGYSNFGPAMAIIELIRRLQNEIQNKKENRIYV